MRILLALATTGLLLACQRSPQQQEIDTLRGEAKQQSAAIRDRADQEADRLDRQAEALETSAEQAGGYTRERLKVRASALANEARIVRKQADTRADAVEEAADAKIKTIESR